MEIAGRHVLVTGAASGIGRACARAVAEAGGIVQGVDVDAGLAEAVASLPGHAHQAHVLDLIDRGALEALFSDLAEVDAAGLVNSAGLVSGGEPWPATPLERIGLVTEVNVVAMARATTLFARRSSGEPACVVNIASVAALKAHPPDPTYAMTKAGVLAFTRSVAAAAAGTSLRVNAVLPGVVETPMLSKTGTNGPATWLRPAGEQPRLTGEQVATEVIELLLGEDSGRAVVLEATRLDDKGVRREDLPV